MGAHSDATTVVPRRVVIVDDEPDIRLLIRHLLERRGWQIAGEAADGSEALSIVAEHQPDVALLDLIMDDTGGEEVLPCLLKVAPSCMVAVLSGLSPAANRQRLLAVGAYAYYSKTQLSALPDQLERDLGEFRRSLSGEETAPAWLRSGAAPRHRRRSHVPLPPQTEGVGRRS